MPIEAPRPSLTEIGRRLGAEKSEPRRDGMAHTDVYETYLRSWRDKPISILEIGIKQGESLRLWLEYFPAARVYGLDVRDCEKFVPDSDRVTAFIGSQEDPRCLIASSRSPGHLT